MKKENGFSLIEVMVALFLLFMLLIFVFGTFITTRKALQFTEDRTNALFLGHSLLNDVRSLNYATLPAPPANPNDCSNIMNGSRTFNGMDNGASFSRVINYNVCVPQAVGIGAGGRLIRAIMTWTEDNQNKTLTMETLITDTSL